MMAAFKREHDLEKKAYFTDWKIRPSSALLTSEEEAWTTALHHIGDQASQTTNTLQEPLPQDPAASITSETMITQPYQATF